MKILLLYLDMLRPDLLNIYSNVIDPTPLDITLKSFGGTIFTNCYSPAPDTPRSCGCLWSGCYPRRNGCDIRIKYPAFFLKNSDASLLALLQKAGYSFNFFIVRSAEKNGLLPPGFENVGYHSGDEHLPSFLSFIKTENLIAENSLTFIHLNDYHYMLDDLHDSCKANSFLNKLVTEIDRGIKINSFDVCIVFSDHGFLSDDENKSLYNQSKLVESRIRLYLQFIYNKNTVTEGIIKDDRLCSIMDLYPTILDLANINYAQDIDGISFLNDNRHHNYILLEDHNSFSTGINMTLNSWGVVDEDGINSIGLDGLWKNEFSDKEKRSFYESEISQKMSFFEENRLKYQILQYYKLFTEYPFFSDGTARNLSYRRDGPIYRIKRLLKFIWLKIRGCRN